MAVSLEVRAPFLDKPVMDFAFSSVPDSQKVVGRRGKIIMQRLAERILPSGFDTNRKMGFSSPLHSWLSGSLKPIVENFQSELSSSDVFSESGVAPILNYQDARHPLRSRQLFQLLVLYLWMDVYNIS